MDILLKQHLTEDGMKECEKVLVKDKKVIKNFPAGIEFFKGCLNGFKETQNFFCLEQFEVLLMKFHDQEEIYKKKLQKRQYVSVRKAYADCLGRRCAVEYMYNNLVAKRGF
jgi:hypothetical protein